MRDAQDAFKFLFTGDHEVILHAALKKLHLSPLHADYDDYLQESRLLFLKVYQRFPDDPLENPHQFLAYAQQKIYWTILDRLRKEQRQNQYRADGDHAALLAELPNTGDLQRDLEVRLYQERLLRLIREEGTRRMDLSERHVGQSPDGRGDCAALSGQPADRVTVAQDAGEPAAAAKFLAGLELGGDKPTRNFVSKSVRVGQPTYTP